MKFKPTVGKVYVGDKYLSFLNHAVVFKHDTQFIHKWDDGVESFMQYVAATDTFSISFPMPDGGERVYSMPVHLSHSAEDDSQFYNLVPRVKRGWQQDWQDVLDGKGGWEHLNTSTSVAEIREEIW
jgi:hypothetical protein